MKKTLTLILLITLFYSNTEAQSWNEIIKTVASDRGTGDWFGYSVAISGSYAIIGSLREDEDAAGLNTMGGAGSVYIFERNAGGIWIETQKLAASDRGPGDTFGHSVAISGNYVIVGAYFNAEDVIGLNTLNNAGAAYIFERNAGGIWSEVQKVVASDRGIDDRFGWSVAISGDYIFVGATFEDEDAAGINTVSFAGSGYIFERSVGGVWNEAQKIVASDRGIIDQFGFSAAISGSYLIVGAREEDEDIAGSNTLSNAGAAYVFERSVGGVWNEVQKIVASDRGLEDQFGYTIAMSGDYAIIGAHREDEDAAGLNTMSTAGSAYVFERSVGGVWSEVQKLVASDRGITDQFGWSVAMSGDYAIIGAHYDSEVSMLNLAGSAYVFERNAGGVWNEVEKIVASDRGVGDQFGSSVGISGDYVLVGATFEDEDAAGLNTLLSSGSAYVFVLCFPTMTSFSVTECGSYTVPSGDETYTAIGSHSVIDTIPNSCGSDSVMTITLTILPAKTGSVNTTLCNESITDIIVNGTTYNTSNPTGTEVFTNIGPNNCDSTVTINLNVLPALMGSVTNTICNYDSVIVNGTIYNLGNPTGTEVFTNIGANNCDSTVTISLNVLPVLTGSVTNTICIEDNIVVNGTMYNAANPSGVEVFANCDSTVTINLTVLPVKIGNVTTTICIEDSLVINGVTYNAGNPTGVEVFTNIGLNNCDSTVTVSLTVLSALTGLVTATICNEDSIVVNGVTYNAGNTSGIEVFTNIGPNNCDSTVTVNLNMLPALIGSVNTTLCNESITDIIVNGTTYNTSNPTGTEVFTNIGANNCDSTVTINLNVLPALIGSVTNTICNYDSIIVNGIIYNLGNPTGTEVFANAGPNNCDSTVTIALNVLPVLIGSVTTTICAEDSIVVNGTTYNALNTTGVEVFANCDSTVTINLTVLSAKTGSVNNTICAEDSLVINGVTYNAVNPSGIEVLTNIGPNNCDSTVTINLIVLPVLIGSVSTTICNEDSVVVNGTTYNIGNPTGTEIFTNVGVNNCDSTVTVNLTILSALTGSVTTTLCNEDSVVVNGITYNAANPIGTEVFTNIGANNCDSTVTINLNVLSPLIGSVTNTVCNYDSIIVNGTIYNLGNPTGTEMFTNVGANNCDSTVTINLNVLPVLTGSVSNTICVEDSIVVNGTTYNAANPAGVEVFSNCDSTVTINLNVLPALIGSVTTTICNEDSIVVNSTIYNAGNPTGTEIFTNIGVNNCDSTVTINLTVLPALIGSITTTICNEDSVVVNGTTYNLGSPSGTEVFTNIGPNNCDSTVTINLNVLPVLTGSVTNTICAEGSIVVNGTTYDAANPTGIEIFTNVGVNNCDSTITISLTITNIDTSTTTTGFVITSNQTGATYQWLDCNNGFDTIVGATNASYTATANGDYAVEVTVNGCIDTSTCVNISTVGINDASALLSNLKLYPNPTKEDVTISNSKSLITRISIITITGQEVYSQENINQPQLIISLKKYPKGIYFVKVQSDKQQKVIKLIKQ